MKLIYIGCFGLLGVFARYYLGHLAARHFASSLPIATFAINILGAFLIGTIYVAGFERNAVPPELRLGLMVGFLGGFTTFSSYCLEATNLAENGEFLRAALYLGISPVLGIVGTFAGMQLTRRVLEVSL